MRKITILLFILTILSCSNNQGKTSNANAQTAFSIKPLIIDNGEEEGWGADIRLSITNVSENDSANIYKTISTYNNQELGFLVSVPKRKEGDKGFGKGIRLESTGKISDNFLQVLTNLYKQKTDTAWKFVNTILLNYVNLNEFAKSLNAEIIDPPSNTKEYKLFFEGNSEDNYAELYLNINTEEHWIELREKDEEYRSFIIRFLRN